MVRRSVVQTLQNARVSGVRLGVTASRPPYAARVHLSAFGSFPEVVGLAGTAADAARRTVGAMADAYAAGRVGILPGAVDAVRRMADLAPLAVASSSPARLIDEGLVDPGDKSGGSNGESVAKS